MAEDTDKKSLADLKDAVKENAAEDKKAAKKAHLNQYPKQQKKPLK